MIWVSLVIGIAMFAVWVYLGDVAQEMREHRDDEKKRRKIEEQPK